MSNPTDPMSAENTPTKLVACGPDEIGDGWFQCHIYQLPFRYDQHAILTAYGRTQAECEANARLIIDAAQTQESLTALRGAAEKERRFGDRMARELSDHNDRREEEGETRSAVIDQILKEYRLLATPPSAEPNGTKGK